MRVLHIVNQNFLKVYFPSPESLELIGEDERLIVSENVDWTSDNVTSLVDFCVQTISKNFEKYPEIINDLPCENRQYLLEILSSDLPLECAVEHIDDEYYWQRRFEEKFGTIKRVKREAWNWKNCYMERHVRQILEQAQPQYDDEIYLDDILTLCSPYVVRLFITELQMWKPPHTMDKEDVPEELPIKHINFKNVLCKLPSLREIDIIVGMNNVGESFTWNMFNVSVVFFQNLGKALLDLKHLTVFRIHRCKMEYPHCQALIQNIIKNKTLLLLDLSNCDFGDDGALVVAKFMMNHPTIKTIILTNNNIRQKGAEGIGFSLLNMKPEQLDSLVMRLNPLGREGTMGILRAIIRCSNPRKLSLSGCLFEGDIPERMGQVIRMNSYLEELDLSNNWFGKTGGEILVSAVRDNTILQELDVRGTDISQAQLDEINQYLQRNKEEADNQDESISSTNSETTDENHGKVIKFL